jgi:putative tryptophan/tyrosine transport system substrate-binding protein
VSAALPVVRSLVLNVVMGIALLSSLAGADQPSIPRIGVMTAGAWSSVEEGLRDGLRELGYVEGKSIVIEWRRSLGTDKELRSLANELASAKVELIVSFSTPAARAALQVTSVPVVFLAGDPVGTGLAASLARPGGQSTGVSMLMPEMVSKRVELLQQVAPGIRRIVFLMNSSNPLNVPMLEEAQTAARTLGVELLPLDARNADELNATLLTMPRGAADGVVVSPDLLFMKNKTRIAQAVRKAKLAAIFPFKEYHDDAVLIMEWTLPTRYGIECAKVEVHFYHLRERERQDEHYSSWHRFGKDGVPGAWGGRAGQDDAAQAT